jgi:hypothetical protein
MAYVVETSYGTKRDAKFALKRIKEKGGRRWQHLMYRYWLRVYFYAIQECPVDTGALRASIRISRSSKEVSGEGVVYRGVPGDEKWEYYISAGGNGIINPKHKKEVDYASAVHDGYVTNSGVFRMGNPFLERAIRRGDSDFNRYFEQWYEEIGKEWEAGGLRHVPPLSYSVPLRIEGE